MKEKRKGRMGIVTNRMSDEVYNKLDEKAQSNQLSQYIIQLVEKDLQDDFLKEQASLFKDRMKEFDSELNNFHKKLSSMSHLLHPKDDSFFVENNRNIKTLVNLEVVSDDKVLDIGFEEDVDLDF